MSIFQSAAGALPGHQAGILFFHGRIYLPHVIRVVHSHYWPPESKRGKITGREHRHSVYHLIFSHRGTGQCRHEGEIRDVRKGSMLCISPGENHLVIMENCRYSAVNFEFLPDGGGEALQIPLPELLGVIGGRHLEAPGNYPLFELGEHEAELERLAGQIRASGDTGPAEAAVALQQFLLALARVAFSPEKDAGDFDKAMAEVKKQIERDFAKPLSLDILAKSVFVSRRSLTRRFRAAYGTSPLAYQNERRMQAALMLLRASDLQIQQIAAETGFSDIYQFSKAFKKFAGKTPSGFRE